MDAKVEAAWIAGAFSLFAALFSIALTLYTQWRTANDNRLRDAAMIEMKAQTDSD